MSALEHVTAEQLRELAVDQGACTRPLLQRVTDTETGTSDTVPIPCGSTREAVCPSCARKARVLRMQQCREGWHLTEDPLPPEPEPDDDQDEDESGDTAGVTEPEPEQPKRRVRSTRRRQDAPDLPKLPVEHRSLGRTFTGPDGTVYRPSMFLTLTLGSYGHVKADGTPSDPETYDYRSAALDALHFSKLVDRFWQNLRRAAGYQVQYFAAVEPQRRLSPHLHAAVRGTMPRETLRQVVAATYAQLWWPAHDEPVYVDTLPVWMDGAGYVDPDTGQVLPTWDQALDALDEQDAGPAHVLRFGNQLDMAGLLAGTEDANKAVGYLCKYLTKSVADTYDGENPKPARRRHLDRLHQETRWLPCTPECPNWLRFGVQPQGAEQGMTPGQCSSKAHAPDTLGLGGRRVLVSRYWTGKTLTNHKADRSTIVKTALEEAGYDAPDVDRCSATVLGSDGLPRYLWSRVLPEDSDMLSYRALLIESIAERRRWRTQYEQAKRQTEPETRSATETRAA